MNIMQSKRHCSTQTAQEKLAEQVRCSLQSTSYPNLRNVTCHADEKTIRLIGTLNSYYEAQLALEAAKRVMDVELIVMEIVVLEVSS